MQPKSRCELDYQDVKLQIVQQEGYDAHDFNLFDDRSSLLWRKPYVDGAVRELTSGDSRSQEQMRLMIERMMLAAGTTNPDVRHTVRKAPRSRVNITLDAEVDDEQDLLTDIRRKPGASLPAQTKHPRARAGEDRPAIPQRGQGFSHEHGRQPNTRLVTGQKLRSRLGRKRGISMDLRRVITGSLKVIKTTSSAWHNSPLLERRAPHRVQKDKVGK